MIYYVYSDELAHHGILGQKWGIRRFQNDDGSLTEAGKKRYGRFDKKKARKIASAAIIGTATAAASSGVAALSKAALDKNVPKGKLLDKTIKSGKDKEPLSPAEKVMKSSQESLNSATDLAEAVIRINRRMDNQGKTNPAKSMSDDELRSAIARLSLEKRYTDLLPAEVDFGMENVKDIIGVVGGLVGIASGVVGSYVALKKLKDGT